MGGSNPPPPSPSSHMPVMQPQLPLTGGRRRRRRGREGPRLYFHLWPPVQVPSFCPASLPSRLLAMEIWPQQVACPAISAPKCPVHDLPTLSRFGKVEKNEGGLRRSGCCSVTVGGCSPAPGESGSARERRIFPPDLSGSSSSAASFCSTDDGQRKMPSSMKRSYQPSQWQFSGQR